MNIQKMMKQAQEMQSKLGSLQSEMESREFEGNSGAGAVKITLTGKGHMVRIALDPTMLSADEKDMLEDLIIAARPDDVPAVDARKLRERQGRKALQELRVVRQHRLHPRLLQHHLADPHTIRIARPSPRQVARMLGIPSEQLTP